MLTRYSGCLSFVFSREQLVREDDVMVAGERAYRQSALRVAVLYPRKLEKQG